MKLIRPKEGLIKSPYVMRRVAEHFRALDTSYTFRMGAGIAGDVNRGHPASILPCLIDSASPPTAYGQAVLVDAASEGVRPVGAGDGAVTDIFGVTVRPYPIQQATTSNNYGEAPYGGAGIPAQQPIDVLRGGYIMVPVNISVATPAKGGTVYIWYAASAGGHTQGGFEGGATGGSTIALSGSYLWNSPPDASGIAELICGRI